MQKYKQEDENYWDYSTKDSVLKSFLHLSPFPQIVLDYRQINHLLSNLIDNFNFWKWKMEDKWKIFCIWSQTNTSTGRFSSSRPNLQSLPKNPFFIVFFLIFFFCFFYLYFIFKINLIYLYFILFYS